MRRTHAKTRVHLTSRKHRALTREAQRLGISLAALVRRIADGYLDSTTPTRPTSAVSHGIVNLGRTGFAGTSRNHHGALDAALGRAPIRSRDPHA